MTTAAIAPVAIPPPAYNEEKNPHGQQIMERVWGIAARVDPTVTFEEYVYWAEIEREEEEQNNKKYVEERGPRTIANTIKGRFSKGVHHENRKREEREQAQAQADAQAQTEQTATEQSEQAGEKKEMGVMSTASPNGSTMQVTDEEWKQASRAMRTASWGTIFFLITTDILGWSTTPFVFASVGYGPGVALYIVFGIAAAVSGWILWQVFLGLDSSRYPMLSFGDTYFRVFGPKSRHFINVAQALQQFMSVSVLILGSALIIAQLSNEDICFIACMVIFTVVGMIVGSIRSLQRVGWLANSGVWLNIVTFIIIMVACANYGIDYSAVTSSTLIKTIEPVRTFAGVPPDQYQQLASGFAGQFNGIDQLVYSFGGAILFVAFLAEMRHPMDFWKGMICAQLFITIVYIVFGCFVYHFYGQYAISNIVNVVQPVRLQTVVNVMYLVTSIIACVLYFNIGLKTVYIEVGQEIFNLPDISSSRGRIMWYISGPLYWILAFVVAAAVPDFSGISSLVGGLLILNFTYSFPALLYVGYRIQLDARLPGEGFDPTTRVTTRHDSGLKRWTRGFMKNWHVNTASILYMLGGLACSGMGCWAAIEGLIETLGPGGTVATSFGCAVPV